MENSILMRLPAEIRVKTYDEVFEGALITVVVDWKDGDRHEIRYKFSSECRLALTCRAIKTESAKPMWRAAVIHAVTEEHGHPVPIHQLCRALPSEIACQVQFLSNVTFHDSKEVEPERGSIELATSYLLQFPKLKICLALGLSVADFLLDLKLDGMNAAEYVGKLVRTTGCDGSRKLVPLEIERRANTREILEYFYNVQEAPGVQMFSLHCFEYEELEGPIDSDESKSYTGVRICFVVGRVNW